MKTNGTSAILVLIPGLISDDIVWREVADALGALVPVMIADVSKGASLAEMAESILAEIPGPLYVAGHSMGGRVALEMVRLAPNRIEKLALVDTGVHPLVAGELEKRQVMVDLAYNEGMAALAERWLPPMVDATRQGDKALMGALTDMVLRADAEQHERQIGALVHRPDAGPLLPSIKCPVLLLAGRQDAWSPPSQHAEMQSKLEDSRLVVIEDAGHFAPIERPEAVAEALKMWITGWR